MFRALLCPSSGARDYVVDYHIGRFVLGLVYVGWAGLVSGMQAAVRTLPQPQFLYKEQTAYPLFSRFIHPVYFCCIHPHLPFPLSTPPSPPHTPYFTKERSHNLLVFLPASDICVRILLHSKVCLLHSFLYSFLQLHFHQVDIMCYFFTYHCPFFHVSCIFQVFLQLFVIFLYIVYEYSSFRESENSEEVTKCLV